MNNYLEHTFVKNTEGNILLNAAHLNGWEVTVPYGEDSNLAQFSKNKRTYFSFKGNVSVNSGVSCSISENKYLTNVVLQKHTSFITHPVLLNVMQLDEVRVIEMLRQYGSVVVKPVDENNGVGVFPGLDTLDDVKSAVLNLKAMNISLFLLENHVPIVNEYRILTWKGSPIDIFRRVPAYVIGDGKRSIAELIAAKNEDRVAKFQNLFDQIIVDQNLTNALLNQQFSLSTILPANEYLTLRSTCNLSQGGETERIEINSIHPDFHKIFSAVFAATNLNYCGIDLICPDLTLAPDLATTAINELNSGPAFSVGFFADIVSGTPFLSAGKLLKAMDVDPI